MSKQRTRATWSAVLAAVVGLTLAGAGWAAPGGPGGPDRHRPRGVDPICARECVAGARECVAGLRADAKICAEDSCPTEHAAAEEACAADPHGEACRMARKALRTCAADCRAALVEGKKACREEGAACLDECPRIPAQGKDRACVGACFAEARECMAPAREALADCRAGCADLRQAARDACSADRQSEACASARADLAACAADCAAPFEEAAAACFEATRSCVEACPEASTE